MPSSSILPGRSDRACFIGPTGCGKSVLAQAALEHYGTDYVVVDPKKQWEPSAAQGPVRLVESMAKLRGALDDSHKDGRPVIVRPSRSDVEQYGWSAPCNEVARLCLERGNTIVYFDELYYVARGSDFFVTAPDYYYAITTGRSLGVGVWGSVQRPAWVPVAALTESDVRYTFFLRALSDRKTVEGLTGPVDWDGLRRNKHSFMAATDMETWGPMRLDLAAGVSKPSA